MDATSSLRDAFAAAVAACQPEAALAGLYPDPAGDRVLVVGAGKPAAAMAKAAEEHYADLGAAVAGVVATPYGHKVATRHITVLEAGHPFPDESSLAAASRVLAAAAAARAGTTALCLIGGGGSALLCAPAGVTLAQKASLSRALMAAGADIFEINTVRKHLSDIKGGKLAATLHPATVHTLAISDVVGDDPATIAAGPTVADPTTHQDALDVLDRYRITAPEARAVLAQGVRGERPETPKPGDPRLAGASYQVVASNETALVAAAASLRSRGWHCQLSGEPEVGEAKAAAAVMARRVAALLSGGGPAVPTAWLSGGEVTVTFRPPASGGEPGRGGPNCEYALWFAARLRSELRERFTQAEADAMLGRVSLLAADSDGVDGASGLAGALFGPGSLALLEQDELMQALERHDTGTYLRRVAAAFERGPTLTNVNDVRFVLVAPA